MADDIEKRLDELEKTIANLWRSIDELYAFHGRMSARWAIDHRTDMAERMRKRYAQ